MFGFTTHSVNRVPFHMQGRVQFNDVGSRFQAHSQIFQYRLNKSSSILHQEYIGLTESDDEDNKTVILFLNNESVNTVFPGKLWRDTIRTYNNNGVRPYLFSAL